MILPQLLQLQNYLHNSVVATLLLLPLVLILLDIVSGVTSALKGGTFSWKMLTDFLGNDFVKYVVVVMIVAGCYYWSGESLATNIATGLGLVSLSASIFASILENLTEINPGLGQIARQLGAMIGLNPASANPVGSEKPASQQTSEAQSQSDAQGPAI